MSVFRFILLVGLIAGAYGDSRTVGREILVETSSGVVQGEIVGTKWGSVLHFYGIPYAKPPTRFQPSEPTLYTKAGESARQPGQREAGMGTPSSRHAYHHHATSNMKVVLKDDTTKLTSADGPPFNGTPINANYSQSFPACPQPAHMVDFKHPAVPASEESLNEDCLRLNIYMPAIRGEEGGRGHLPPKHPILVWIPGDGFSFGDAIHYDGSALAAGGNIMVVVVNYRVGVFGFLSTGDKHIRGNAGLSDILSALEWIHENAEEFNGDESQLTLGGRFSGSMAISALISSPAFLRNGESEPLSPLAQRIILHGGIVTNPWVIDTHPNKRVTTLMKITNCAANELEKSLKCLRELSTKTLLDMSMRVPEMFRPVIDGNILIIDPMEAIYNGVTPTNSSSTSFLIGDNNGAGSLCYQSHTYLSGEMLDKIQANTITLDDLRLLLRGDLKTFYHIDDEGLAALVAHEYLNTPKSMKLSYRNLYTHICGLLFLRIPSEISARYLSRTRSNLVYRYELDGQFESEPVRETRPVPKWFETALGSEIILLFPTKQYNMTEAEEIISNNMTSAYINFVRTGVPGSENWKPFDEEEKQLVIFGDDGLQFEDSRYLNRDVEFWLDAFSKVVATYRKFTFNGTELCTEEVAVPDSNQTHFHTATEVHRLCEGAIREMKENGIGVNSALLGATLALTGIFCLQFVTLGFYIRGKLKKNQLIAEFVHSG